MNLFLCGKSSAYSLLLIKRELFLLLVFLSSVNKGTPDDFNNASLILTDRLTEHPAWRSPPFCGIFKDLSRHGNVSRFLPDHIQVPFIPASLLPLNVPVFPATSRRGGE